MNRYPIRQALGGSSLMKVRIPANSSLLDCYVPCPAVSLPSPSAPLPGSKHSSSKLCSTSPTSFLDFSPTSVLWNLSCLSKGLTFLGMSRAGLIQSCWLSHLQEDGYFKTTASWAVDRRCRLISRGLSLGSFAKSSHASQQQGSRICVEEARLSRPHLAGSTLIFLDKCFFTIFAEIQPVQMVRYASHKAEIAPIPLVEVC